MVGSSCIVGFEDKGTGRGIQPLEERRRLFGDKGLEDAGICALGAEQAIVATLTSSHGAYGLFQGMAKGAAKQGTLPGWEITFVQRLEVKAQSHIID